MKKNLQFLFFLFATVFFCTGSLQAQDIITKKDGERLKVIIKEISDSEIRYTDYRDPDGVIFVMDRALVREIKFSYGKRIKEEAPNQDEAYYVDDKVNNIKMNFTAIGAGFTILSYERALNPISSVEGSIKIPGWGVQRDGERSSGFGVNIGYRLKFGSLFKKEGYRPKHLLHGYYFRPNIGYLYSKTENEDAIIFSSAGNADVTRSFFHGGLDFGYQWILNNILSIDLYAGIHYYGGGIDRVESNGQVVESDNFIDDFIDARGGDFIGNDNIGGTFGLKVGVLFGTKKK